MADQITATQTLSAPPLTSQVIPPAASWVDSLKPELKTFVQEHGIKEPTEVIEPYQNLLKLRGVAADKLIRTPDSYSDAKEQEAAWNSIYDRLGRPKTPAEYGIENAEHAEDSKFLAETFHKLGLNKNQAAEISKAVTERAANATKGFQENQQLLAKQSVDKLRQEWGSTYDSNMQLAKSGQKALGWDDKMVDSVANAIGIDRALKALNDAGRRVGEGTYIQGNTGNVTHTPDTAKSKIDQLRTDKSFTDKLMSGDAMAKAQWDALHSQWASGQNYG
jgi:hypothetical protein